MAKQNSWFLTKEEAEDVLQNLLDDNSIYLSRQMVVFITQNHTHKNLTVQR